ncbi:sensor histidine kinase, partial [Dysgonomonas mossii]|uniref:sensor histidine kinase n=3 Tax=Dysgonomonas TaxID=156973 RepID=UPI001AC7C69A
GLKFYFEQAKLYEQHLILQKEHLETQLQSLQAQINPHFMFNVLNHIHILIQKDSDLASSLLIKYSDILRYQLYGSDKESVNIEDEIRFMKGYIEVERYRWENTLDFNANWQLENPKMQVPSLLLIPFIENAFKHVSRSKSHKGYISINLNQNNKELTFEVENSKSSIKRTTASNSGIGLDNVKKRLNILYPNKHSLIISETENIYHSKLIINLSNDGESK